MPRKNYKEIIESGLLTPAIVGKFLMMSTPAIHGMAKRGALYHFIVPGSRDVKVPATAVYRKVVIAGMAMPPDLKKAHEVYKEKFPESIEVIPLDGSMVKKEEEEVLTVLTPQPIATKDQQQQSNPNNKGFQ